MQAAFRQDFGSKVGGKALFRVQFEKVFTRYYATFAGDQLIQAFQADPLLLILDEPTESLDPLMQESFYELLADARNRGRTVFMSSHVLPEVERVCDRIAVLRKGRVVLLSSVEDARKLARLDTDVNNRLATKASTDDVKNQLAR